MESSHKFPKKIIRKVNYELSKYSVLIIYNNPFEKFENSRKMNIDKGENYRLIQKVS